ncbi:ADP-ribosylation/Crystallin J1 [Kalaharituber pfeilii]|nr:ADP-ribosylation/Crystallin J1 [Kalaharituber pfeilii]
MCDALGVPAEFRVRGSYPRITDYLPSTTYNTPPGTYSDDTSMALCLCDAMTTPPAEGSDTLSSSDTSRIPPETEASRLHFAALQAHFFIRWHVNGHTSPVGYAFDVGNATRIALALWASPHSKSGANPEGAQDFRGKPISPAGTMVGAADPAPQPAAAPEDESISAARAALTDVDRVLNRESGCGNGSLMRILPIALAYWRNAAHALDIAADNSRITHPHSRCIEACRIYVLLATAILEETHRRVRALEENANLLPPFTKRELFDLLLAIPITDPVLAEVFSAKGTAPHPLLAEGPAPPSSGYVVDTLFCALWAFFRFDSFAEGALELVNLGNDTDTIAAVYGGLAGLWYADGLPDDGRSRFWADESVRRWYMGLSKREWVIERGEKVADLGGWGRRRGTELRHEGRMPFVVAG